MRTFNGTNQSLYNNAFTALQGLSKGTISCWLKRATASDKAMFGAYGSGLGDAFGVLLWSDGNAYAVYGNGDQTQYASAAASGTAVMHCGLQFDGTQSGDANKLKLRVNKSNLSLTYNVATNTVLSPNLANIYAGKRPNGPEFGAGSFGLAGIWGGVTLSDADLDDLADGAAHPSDFSSGLLAWWDTDETSGNAADGSGNGVTLTAENGPGYEDNPVGGGGGTPTRVILPPRILMAPYGLSRARRGV